MVEKNVVGMYNIKDEYPVFQHEDDDERQVDAVDYSIPITSRVAAIRGVVGNVDPLDQWRDFSERLKARRLAREEAGQQMQQYQAAEPAPHSRVNSAPRSQKRSVQQDLNFQRSYEHDMVDISQSAHPAVLNLQRYLSMVNTPVTGEQIQAYEPADEDELKDSGELLVRDVMVRKVVCVLETTTIEQVASICNRRGFSGVPVVNHHKGLIGIVTLTDIIQQLFAHESVSLFANQGGQVLEQKALAILDEPTSKYMNRDVVTVTPETSVQTACRKMMDHNIRRVVVARGDLVKGIFSAQDAVRILATAQMKVQS